MPRAKRTFSPQFREEAVKLVIEGARPIAVVARELGIGEGTLGNWVAAYRREHAGDEPPLNVSERERLRQLERELRDPHAADRWTWLIIAAHTQLRLALPLATDLRRPWERPAPPERLTPSRVRRGFRHLRTATLSPAGAPKPTPPGPGRPPGTPNRQPNRQPTRRYDVHIATSSEAGKTTSRKKKSTNPRPRRTG